MQITQQTKLRVASFALITSNVLSPSSESRSSCRVKPCCSTSSTRPKCMGSTVECVETWRAEWNLGL